MSNAAQDEMYVSKLTSIVDLRLMVRGASLELGFSSFVECRERTGEGGATADVAVLDSTLPTGVCERDISRAGRLRVLVASDA
jgi:hypothetical protein